MLGDATMYPTAVYVGDTNEILNLLPDMDGSIRTDDPTKQPRS